MATTVEPKSVAVITVVDDDIYASIKKATGLIGELDISPESRVVIKPNLCSLASAKSGATTDVRVVEAVIRILREISPACRITVVESDSHGRTAEEAFLRHGYVDLERKYDVKLVNLTKDQSIKVDELKGPPRIPIALPRTLISCDYFISIAKLKTHVFERISCVLKNQFGCIPQKQKAAFHPYLSQILLALNRLVRTDLCIIDGITAMEARGPTAGVARRTNLIIVGKDPVAVDSVASRIMGITPESVPHLKYAAKHHLGDIHNIEIFGERLSSIEKTFAVPRGYEFLLYRLSFFLTRIRVVKLGNLMFRAGGFLGRSKKNLLETICDGFVKAFKRAIL